LVVAEHERGGFRRIQDQMFNKKNVANKISNISMTEWLYTLEPLFYVTLMPRKNEYHILVKYLFLFHFEYERTSVQNIITSSEAHQHIVLSKILNTDIFVNMLYFQDSVLNVKLNLFDRI